MLGAVIQHEKKLLVWKKSHFSTSEKSCSVPEAEHFYLFNLYFFKIFNN